MPLDKTVRETLVSIVHLLRVEGVLPTEEALKLAYGRFRERFGPEALKTLEGERLLQWYDSSNHDSLTYWLNQGKMQGATGIPEIPGRFGLIGSGGHYQRLRIFRRETDGQWVAGKSPKAGRQVSHAEAMRIVGGFRDELLAGFEVLARLSTDGSDETYAKLQQQLEAAAPDLVDRAWAHKYFHMLHPTLLDDFHTLDTQRKRLSLLGREAPAGAGRYRSAGRFVLAARELGVPMNHLTAALNNWDRVA